MVLIKKYIPYILLVVLFVLGYFYIMSIKVNISLTKDKKEYEKTIKLLDDSISRIDKQYKIKIDSAFAHMLNENKLAAKQDSIHKETTRIIYVTKKEITDTYNAPVDVNIREFSILAEWYLRSVGHITDTDSL